MLYFIIKRSRRIIPRLLLLFIICTSKLYSQTPYAESLIKKANELSLYNDSYWLLLCHYKRTLTGYKSLIDGKDFFLSPDGKTNPKKELDATIQSFFTPEGEKKAHPTYKFSARYKWLCSKLEIDKSLLPYDGDKDYEVLKERISPQVFYLIFPAAYMNNPASMFGHLFYLIESKNVPHLAGLSINYGAVTTDSPSFIYAVKGLLGFYPGKYDIIPYYQQITKYSYLDMRDTWEYKLQLNDDENDYFMRHIIEMTFTYSNYYYLNENCAYNLLYPLEVARPSTKLTKSFGAIVEPIQVIQKLQKENLLGEAQYRPSLYQKMEYEKSFLTNKQKKFVKKLCYGKTEPSKLQEENITLENQANLWEFASDYLKYLLSNNKITLEEYQKRFLSVLTERNKLKNVESLAKNIQTPKEQPQKAHGSSMLNLGGSYIDQNLCAEAKFRHLTHSLMDTDSGYTPNSQIEFFTGSVRYDFTNNDFSFRYADIANIISLSVCDRFIKKKSFQFRTGLSQNKNKEGDEDLTWRLKYSLGFSTLLTPKNQFYAFAGFDTFCSPEYDYFVDALGGAELGIITTSGIWKQNLLATVYQSPFDLEHTRFNFSAEERIAFHQNASLKAFYSFCGDFRQTWHEAGGSFNFYF